MSAHDYGLAAFLAALDRCEHGRHLADKCFDCPGGQSTGNLFLPPGTRIGTTLYGEAVVAPEMDVRRQLERWTETGRGVK